MAVAYSAAIQHPSTKMPYAHCGEKHEVATKRDASFFVARIVVLPHPFYYARIITFQRLSCSVFVGAVRSSSLTDECFGELKCLGSVRGAYGFHPTAATRQCSGVT